MSEQVVSAACRHPRTGEIQAGSHHGECWYRLFPLLPHRIEIVLAYIESRYGRDALAAGEGFVTNTGRFVSRSDALALSGYHSHDGMLTSERWLGAA